MKLFLGGSPILCDLAESPQLLCENTQLIELKKLVLLYCKAHMKKKEFFKHTCQKNLWTSLKKIYIFLLRKTNTENVYFFLQRNFA